jgi:hypothetical protein
VPELIAACDWSMSPHKRWFATAARSETGWLVRPPQPVGPLDSFFADLRRQRQHGKILVGFDFPIGIPRRYAECAAIDSFTAWLPRLGNEDWADFYKVAETSLEVSLKRPFYPRAPGGKRKQHLIDALGLGSTDHLLRACDRATRTRGRACEIFWTLGPSQVGRAAISGWRDLLAPALRNGTITLWPFDIDLDSDGIVAAEIYPAETYSHLGVPRSFGKGSAEARRAQARTVLEWCSRNSIGIVPELKHQIESGFATDDEFDAFIGLLGMIEAVADPERQAIPPDPAIRALEGWILGMPCPALL